MSQMDKNQTDFDREDYFFLKYLKIGKDLLCKQFSKIIDRGLTIEESHIFNNLIDISTYPCALLMFKECIMQDVLYRECIIYGCIDISTYPCALLMFKECIMQDVLYRECIIYGCIILHLCCKNICKCLPLNAFDVLWQGFN